MGVLENFGITFFSSSYRDVFAFAFVFIALTFRPEGLFVFQFGKKKRS